MMASRHFRRGALMAAGASVFALTACNNALDVTNPKYIDEGQLSSPALASVLLNTAVGAVNTNYSEFSWFSAIITDEALNATNDVFSGELSQRIIELAQGNAGPYRNLQYTRATADTAAGRLRGLSAKPVGDLKLARALAYAGLSYIYLADFTCEAPLNGGPMVQDDSLYKIALSRFKEAIADAAGGTPALVADSIANLARVGAARASLNLGDKAGAIAYASAVTNPFVVYADYIVSGNTTLNNTLYVRVNGQNKQLGLHPLQQGKNDPRFRYVTAAVLGHNQTTLLNVPYSPRSYSTWKGGPDSVAILANSSIEIASQLEARYIRAEAEGPTALTAALVAERRAAGNEPVLPAGADLMAALREEKLRDFMLSGRRLGDLRRYIKQGVGDFFPSGPHPTSQWGLYGSATCYIVSQDEVNSNPNLVGYTPPNTRPPGYSP
jgi:hypothetical protein